MLIASSDEASVYVLLKNSYNFLEDVKSKFKIDYNKLLRHFERFAQYGTIQDETKFNHLEDNLYEFKTHKVRVFSFIVPDRPNKTIIVCSFHKKQKQKSPANDLQKARNISSTVLELIKNNQIEFGE